uniref:Uncharacterized protein n=1 Tax=Trichogramma kaykai TaxID=54128 RepID=A0ABD2XDZ9_9HYME
MPTGGVLQLPKEVGGAARGAPILGIDLIAASLKTWQYYRSLKQFTRARARVVDLGIGWRRASSRARDSRTHSAFVQCTGSPDHRRAKPKQARRFQIIIRSPEFA